MTFLQDAQVFVDTCHNTCYSGLTGTRTACEYEVIAEVRSLQTLFLTLFLYLYEIGQGAYFCLNLLEANQVVEFLVGVTLDGFVDNDGTVATAFRTVLVCELVFASTCIITIAVDDEMAFFRTT